jgi:hypothetical protein
MPDQIDLGAMFLEKMIEVPSTMTHEQNDPPWNPDQAILIWQHFANVGGADKDRMVTVSTWLLSFSGTIIGYIAIQEWGGTESNPLVAIILAFLGMLVSSLALAIITIYASYSNWNWGMADAIAKRYGWYDLYPNEAVDELYKKYDDYELPNCEEEYPKNFPTIIYIVHLNYCFYYFTKVLKFLKNQLVSNGGQYQQTM